jgi:ABC-type phosphate transport system permease subunit
MIGQTDRQKLSTALIALTIGIGTAIFIDHSYESALTRAYQQGIDEVYILWARTSVVLGFAALMGWLIRTFNGVRTRTSALIYIAVGAMYGLSQTPPGVAVQNALPAWMREYTRSSPLALALIAGSLIGMLGFYSLIDLAVHPEPGKEADT